MMSATMRRTALSAILLLAAEMPAYAHVGVGTTSSFTAGFIHPFSGFDHMTVMVAVGLWAALKGGKAICAWPLALWASCWWARIGMLHVPLPFVEPAYWFGRGARPAVASFDLPSDRHAVIGLFPCSATHTAPRCPKMPVARIYGRPCRRHCAAARHRHQVAGLRAPAGGAGAAVGVGLSSRVVRPTRSRRNHHSGGDIELNRACRPSPPVANSGDRPIQVAATIISSDQRRAGDLIATGTGHAPDTPRRHGHAFRAGRSDVTLVPLGANERSTGFIRKS